MKFLWIIIIVLLKTTVAQYGDFASILFGSSPRTHLNFTELAAYDGYTSESHTVTTSDGYILGVFRLPLQKKCQTSKGVIIFMHGLYLSGDDCLIPGPQTAHCYIYADNCYDVWVPNSRGNRYSLQHIKYNAETDDEFWDFAFDEMGIYDLPAVIDYILKITGEKQVSFVGHSQGAALLLVLCSKKPEYNNKIKVGFGLSVTAWLTHSRFVVIALEGVLSPLLRVGRVNAGILPYGGLIQTTVKTFCGSSLSYPLCSLALFSVMGFNRYQITADTLPVVFGHMPAGISLKNFFRWGQIRVNGFTEYDYGSEGNLAKYGQVNPPLYEVKNITMKWVFLASYNDFLSDIQDLEVLTSKLPSSETCILKDKYFGHLDYVYGKDIPVYITPTILTYLATGALECH